MKEKMLKEALERLEMLGLKGPCTKQLKESGTVFYSEKQGLAAYFIG